MSRIEPLSPWGRGWGGVCFQRLLELLERHMPDHIHRVPVVEAGAFQCAVVEAEAEPTDEVEPRPVAAQSRATLPVFGGISGSHNATCSIDISGRDDGANCTAEVRGGVVKPRGRGPKVGSGSASDKGQWSACVRDRGLSSYAGQISAIQEDIIATATACPAVPPRRGRAHAVRGRCPPDCGRRGLSPVPGCAEFPRLNWRRCRGTRGRAARLGRCGPSSGMVRAHGVVGRQPLAGAVRGALLWLGHADRVCGRGRGLVRRGAVAGVGRRPRRVDWRVPAVRAGRFSRPTLREARTRGWRAARPHAGGRLAGDRLRADRLESSPRAMARGSLG